MGHDAAAKCRSQRDSVSYRQLHLSPLHRISAARHGPRGLDELTANRHDPPSFAEVVRPPRRRLQIRRDDGVADGQEQGRRDGDLSGINKVEKPGRALRRLHGAIVRSLIHLVERHEARPTEVVTAQVFEALLGPGGRLHDNVIEHPARGRDGDVVLLVDGSEVAESAHNAAVRELAALPRGLENGGRHA